MLNERPVGERGREEGVEGGKGVLRIAAYKSFKRSGSVAFCTTASEVSANGIASVEAQSKGNVSWIVTTHRTELVHIKPLDWPAQSSFASDSNEHSGSEMKADKLTGRDSRRRKLSARHYYRLMSADSALRRQDML
jgi:hypothetical protein